jgi:hypothetical protein
MISFERFLIRAGKEQNFENVIALYSINNTNIIQNKGISYPAFRLTITDVLKYLAVYGYLIKVNSQFVDPKTALLSGQALYDSMRVSTTKTGAFIEIKSTYSQAQIQELEALYKKKWGIN